MKSRNLVLVSLGLAAALCGGAAMAQDSVQWSVTIGGGSGGPVYTPAVPVYTPAVPVYTRPVPVYSHPGYRGHEPRGYRSPTRWDRDGDGIPNRHDRVYNPRWDRDGDRIPNWKDRHDNRGGGWHR
jgi:hypothetical protein